MENEGLQENIDDGKIVPVGSKRPVEEESFEDGTKITKTQIDSEGKEKSNEYDGIVKEEMETPKETAILISIEENAEQNKEIFDINLEQDDMHKFLVQSGENMNNSNESVQKSQESENNCENDCRDNKCNESGEGNVAENQMATESSDEEYEEQSSEEDEERLENKDNSDNDFEPDNSSEEEEEEEDDEEEISDREDDKVKDSRDEDVRSNCSSIDIKGDSEFDVLRNYNNRSESEVATSDVANISDCSEDDDSNEEKEFASDEESEEEDTVQEEVSEEEDSEEEEEEVDQDGEREHVEEEGCNSEVAELTEGREDEVHKQVNMRTSSPLESMDSRVTELTDNSESSRNDYYDDVPKSITLQPMPEGFDNPVERRRDERNRVLMKREQLPRRPIPGQYRQTWNIGDGVSARENIVRREARQKASNEASKSNVVLKKDSDRLQGIEYQLKRKYTDGDNKISFSQHMNDLRMAGEGKFSGRLVNGKLVFGDQSPARENTREQLTIDQCTNGDDVVSK